MKSWALDADNDIKIVTLANGKKTIAVIEGVEETIQSVKLHLTTWLGEDHFHPEIGLPIPSMVGAKTPDYIRGVVTDALRKVPQILAVNNFSVRRDPDHEQVNIVGASILTSDGLGTLSTEVG